MVAQLYKFTKKSIESYTYQKRKVDEGGPDLNHFGDNILRPVTFGT